MSKKLWGMEKRVIKSSHELEIIRQTIIKSDLIKLISHLDKSPLCERCNRRQAKYFTLYKVYPASFQKPTWLFTCGMCTTPRRDYAFETKDFFKQLTTTKHDWIFHLNCKTWMDFVDFLDMIKRFEIKILDNIDLYFEYITRV